MFDHKRALLPNRVKECFSILNPLESNRYKTSRKRIDDEDETKFELIMSKIGKSSGLVDIKPVTTTTAFGRLTRASSNAAKLATGKSVVSIEVNMESSYEMNAPPAAAAKKKRLALGNISNADGVQQSGQPPNAAAPVTKDAKKYRFGGSNIANIASVMPGFGPKKSDNVPLTKKTSSNTNKPLELLILIG